MSDYITMVNRIADEMDDDSLTSQIKLAIQSAINFYARKRFWFTQVQFTFPIAADDEYFDSGDSSEIPNVLEIDSFSITDSAGIRYSLFPLSNSIIDESQDGFQKSTPSNWSYIRSSIRIFPIAIASYTATVEAWSRLTTLSADADTNAWMTDAEELIRQRAKRILAMDITKEPTDAQAAQALEEMALQGLMEENRLRRGRQFARVDPALVATGRTWNYRTGDC